MSQIRVKITVFVCMIQRIDAMRLRNSMSERRRNKSGIERLGRIWCCWQFFLLQFAHHGFTLDEKDWKNFLCRKKGATTKQLLQSSYCSFQWPFYASYSKSLILQPKFQFLLSIKMYNFEAAWITFKISRINTKSWLRLWRVNRKSLFSSIQYASPLDGAWTKKQLLSLHVISHLETRLSLGCCVQQAMLKILRQHHNNHKSRIFHHRKLHDDMLSTFFYICSTTEFYCKTWDTLNCYMTICSYLIYENNGQNWCWDRERGEEIYPYSIVPNNPTASIKRT